MNIYIEQHPTDPCGRLRVTGTEKEIAQVDLLFQAIMSTRHKEAKYIDSQSFEAFFQLDPPINE